MDKKSPEQQKPEGVDTKPTDTFGNKGVVMTMRHVPDDELPVDAEGNRAEILDLGNGTLPPFPNLAGSPSPRTAMFGEQMGASNSNPLGIESIVEREAELFKEYVNETLTDDQKMALSMLGEIVGGDYDHHQTGLMTITISVPIDAGKTSRVQALRKLLDETPPGGIRGYWKYPVQGEQFQNPNEHQVSVSINDDQGNPQTKLLFREYPAFIDNSMQTKEQRLQSLAESHPVRPGESVCNTSVFYDDAFSPLSLAMIFEPLPISKGKFKRYAKYQGQAATLETCFIEVDGVQMEQLLAMTLYSLAVGKKRTMLYDLQHGNSKFILVKVNN